MQRPLVFSAGDQRIAGDIHIPDGPGGPFPCIITSHGYKSNRDSDKYIQIGFRFPLENIAVLRFDHRGALNGESEGAFEDTTLTGRIEDIVAAMEALEGVPEVDASRLGLLGSSLGGMDIILVQSDAVRARVAIATPVTFPHPSEAMTRSVAEKGYYDYPDGTRMKGSFYEDLRRHDMSEAARRLKCPLLIIHGDLDEVVPRHHASMLYQAASSEVKELRYIEGGDHAFTNLDKANEVLSLALDWFKRYL